MTTAALVLTLAAAALLAGRLYEARARNRVPDWARPVTARDLRRALGETGPAAAWRRHAARSAMPLTTSKDAIR